MLESEREMDANYFIFSTGGDWDSTTLYNNADEYLADQLYIEIKSGRDDNGNPTRGGLSNGGNMTAYVSPQGSNGQQVSIFPSRIDLEFPLHKICLFNDTPNFQFEVTRIELDGVDVSNQVVDFLVNIDALKNDVQAYLMMYKHHLLGSDEVATLNLL